jgi:hypothetical protein
VFPRLGEISSAGRVVVNGDTVENQRVLTRLGECSL